MQMEQACTSRVGSAFALMQSELTAKRLLDKLINISLTDGFILEEEGLYTREVFGDHQRFQSHSSPY